MRSLVGHGIGRDMHEDPQIPNFGDPGRGPLLEEGMVLAIEPMATAGRHAVRMGDDGWAIYSQDGSLAAHFEFTVAVTADGPRILTPVAPGHGPRGGVSAAAPVVAVAGLHKRYGSAPVEAVAGVNFDVREGEIFGLLGPNGAGKTTTIGTITTRVRPTGGSVTVDGFDVVRAPVEVKQRIAVVPQLPNLDRTLTALENLIFHAAYFGEPRARAASAPRSCWRAWGSRAAGTTRSTTTRAAWPSA